VNTEEAINKMDKKNVMSAQEKAMQAASKAKHSWQKV